MFDDKLDETKRRVFEIALNYPPMFDIPLTQVDDDIIDPLIKQDYFRRHIAYDPKYNRYTATQKTRDLLSPIDEARRLLEIESMKDWYVIEDEKPKRKPHDITPLAGKEEIKLNVREKLVILVWCWIVLGAIFFGFIYLLQHPDWIPYIFGAVAFIGISLVIWFNLK